MSDFKKFVCNSIEKLGNEIEKQVREELESWAENLPIQGHPRLDDLDIDLTPTKSNTVEKHHYTAYLEGSFSIMTTDPVDKDDTSYDGGSFTVELSLMHPGGKSLLELDSLEVNNIASPFDDAT